MKRSIPISSIIVFWSLPSWIRPWHKPGRSSILDSTGSSAARKPRYRLGKGNDSTYREDRRPGGQNQYQGRFIYQKSFIPEQSPGQKTFLYFEGVMMNTRLYFNGKNIATHMGGYLPFTVDISQYIKPGVRILLGWKLRIQTILQFPGKPLKELDF